MRRTVEFDKFGYDPFITFMKGYAILCVLLAHAIPNPDATGYALWGGMQVPLFLLIQTFHSFKRKPNFNFKKLLKRVVLPFLLVQLVLVAISCGAGNIYEQLRISIMSGGRGPGSYYFWIYLQFSILLPILYPLLNKLRRTYLLIFFLLISEGCEVLSSLISIPEPIYRLLCLRYLFLIYLGIEWVHRGIVMNKRTIALSFLSIGMIVYFTYFDPSLEPFFFKTAWRYHRWICYFYAAYLLAWFLSVVFNVIKDVKFPYAFMCLLGEASYEIYLTQMAAFVLLRKSFLSFLPNYLISPLWMIMVIAVSILGGILFHRFWKKYVLR